MHCRDCKWCVALPHQHLSQPYKGECYLNPPTFVFEGYLGRAPLKRPEVKLGDFCSKFEIKPLGDVK